MSVTSQIPRKVSTATPGATLFPYDFKVLSKFDILVEVNGVAKTVDVDYIVSGVGLDAGGDITFIVPLAGGETVMRKRDMSFERTNDFQQLGDLRSPTLNNDQDAPIMMLQQVADDVSRAIKLPKSSTGSGDISGLTPLAPLVISADGNGVEAGDTTLTGDMLLRPNLAEDVPGKGGDLIGFRDTTIRQKLVEDISVRDFGGIDDGSTDVGPALVAAKAAAAVGGRVHLPKTESGAYLFDGAIAAFEELTIDPDPGVQINADDAAFPLQLASAIRTTQNLKVHNTSLNYDYQLSSQFGKPFDHKSMWMNDADIAAPVTTAIALANLNHEAVSWPASDTWVSAAGQATAGGSEPYPFINWNGLTNTTWYASTISVRGGDEITASFDTTGGYQRLAVLRTVSGYYGIYAGGSGGAPTMIYKPIGGSAVTSTIGSGTQFTTQPQYYPENCVWTIRVLDRRHFEILLNGVSVTGVQVTEGDIYRAGFGVMSGAVTTMSITGWAKTQRTAMGGKQPVRIIIYGDSMSADIHGHWPAAMREALDGSNGTRVADVMNRAVPGYTSAQALASMTTNGVAGYSFCVIGVGTNDIQQGVSVATCLGNIASMVGLCAAAGVVPVVWIPPLWYGQAQAGAGTGQPTSGSTTGSAIRAAILRYCGANSVACVDMTMVTGPIDVRYLTQTLGVSGADPMVRDNIHPTAYCYRLFGQAIARRILGMLCYQPTRVVDFTLLNPVMQNSWQDATSSARIRYSVSAEGRVSLSGVVSNGPSATKTDGTAFMTLPEHLRPAQEQRFIVANNITVAPNYVAGWVQIDVTGVCTIYGMTANANFFTLDNISFASGG